MPTQICLRIAGLLALMLAMSDMFLAYKQKDLSEILWDAAITQREDALNSKFIQGLNNGTLDPSDFGGYMVQDSIFCYNAKVSIDRAKQKTHNADLKNTLQKLSDDYKQYYEDLFDVWHINNPSGIDLNAACADYIQAQRKAADMTTIYFIVALIPCERLWPWLGEQIMALSDNFGVYDSWVRSNLNPKYDGYKALEKLVNDAFKAGNIDLEKAQSIYYECMTGEAAFFGSV